MRGLAAVVAGCLLLTGCAASWQGEARYKIVSLDSSGRTEYFDLELVGDAPKGALDAAKMNRDLVRPGNVTGGAAVGNEIICAVRQSKGGAFEDSNVQTYVDDCRKA
jgi:hypothetical protein